MMMHSMYVVSSSIYNIPIDIGNTSEKGFISPKIQTCVLTIIYRLFEFLLCGIIKKLRPARYCSTIETIVLALFVANRSIQSNLLDTTTKSYSTNISRRDQECGGKLVHSQTYLKKTIFKLCIHEFYISKI